MDTSGPSDIQSQFESQKGRNDFLTAEKIDDWVGLCLSGGGYRAMLFHAGALVRLNEFSVLSKLQEVSSVSGGSIAAGQLAAAWPNLGFDETGKAGNLAEMVIDPLVRFASVNLDIKAALSGILPGRTAAETVAAAYDRHLFRGATLQDIPDKPRFTFMATNLQTGSGWRFAKAYAADHRVGRINAPRISLATVVAASSAFPPFLSPLRLTFEAGVVEPMAGADLHRPPFTEHAVLTDGGVYDNLGLERVWRRCRTILVSNAGLSTPEIGSPTGKWIGQIYRSLNLIQQAAENSRKRILFGVHNLGQRKVAYWDIGTAPSSFGLNDASYDGVRSGSECCNYANSPERVFERRNRSLASDWLRKRRRGTTCKRLGAELAAGEFRRRRLIYGPPGQGNNTPAYVKCVQASGLT
ncbi:NTE family protein [Bradyrhizobium sp. GM0.4]